MDADRPGRHSPHLRVFTINIYVHDQDMALRFYADQLGFRVAFDVQVQSGERWMAVAPPDGTALLMIIAPKPDSKEYELIGRPTGVVFLTEDLIAKYTEWLRRGVRFQYAPRLRRVRYSSASEDTWGGVFSHFRDLDGNTFALVGFDEVTRQIEAERRAFEDRVEAERRAAQELDIAKQVQAKLFPNVLPPLQTLGYAGTCLQARQVGGDYFDFIDLGRHRLGMVVGDIAGKGIAAALLMANLQANFRIHCAACIDKPQQLLQSVNQVFYKNTTDSAYATLFFGEYDDETRRLRYINCGHLPGLLLRGDNTLERLDATATVVGLFGEWDCAAGDRTLFPGDSLALYTDGITEAFNRDDEQFGEYRLIDALRRYRHLPPQAIIDAVVAEVQNFSSKEQHDDITLTIAKCH